MNGWGFPSNSKKAHYFVDKQSLCHRWAFFGEVFDDKHHSASNCKMCMKKRNKLEIEKQKVQPK